MFLLKATLPLLPLLLSFTSAAALPSSLSLRAPAIPGAPADPPKPADGDGIGPYKSKDAGWKDHLSKTKFFSIAVAAGEIGLNNAERGMRHYLDNSGKDLNVAPGPMMKDLPKFREAAQALAQNEATAAYKAISEATGSKTFSSKWSTYYATKDQSWDWFYAIGGFSYSVTGVVTKASGGGSLQYRIHIFDRYNWDAGKSVDIGPFHFEDRELGELHLKGLAREYVVRGSGEVNEVKDFKPGTVIPSPSTGGRN
ncbi:hypothetical protein CC80DRAFT_511024 [Byssothecium circinans]|uniref:Uncharacterized protein n=1 Tax=Byssothecium circinans TaxID=147558 RepID=A0A6A5T8C5_9PLEO|nr:hypothetical protein CC80DRAFT_511024 [Byssothecium circinans]